MKIFEYPDGATPLNPQEIDGLRLRHISVRSELDRWEQENIQEALDWLTRRRKKGSILSETFLCQLHEKMFGKVWKWAGTFRHSRMITDILLTDVFGINAFSWGSGNLVEAGEVRKQYIAALKAADEYDYSLLQVFVKS